jgi:Sulfotransferase family
VSKPILVTGSHRSGTTWVGRMLCLSHEAGYIHEPFNPNRRPGWSGTRIPCWFLYVDEHNEAHYRDVLEDVLAFRYPIRLNLAELRGPVQLGTFALDLQKSLVHRLRGVRPLVKDPIALFSAEWLARTFDMDVVVMIRHPAAFIGSLKKLDWQFRFRGWLQQKELLRDLLHPYEQQMRHYWNNPPDIIDQGVLLWNAMHHVIERYRERHPEWQFLRHEDVAAAPLDRFEQLYESFDLRFDGGVEERVARFSGAGNPGEVASWRRRAVRRDSAATATTWTERLTMEEVDRIRAGTAELAGVLYADQEW